MTTEWLQNCNQFFRSFANFRSISIINFTRACSTFLLRWHKCSTYTEALYIFLISTCYGTRSRNNTHLYDSVGQNGKLCGDGGTALESNLNLIERNSVQWQRQAHSNWQLCTCLALLLKFCNCVHVPTVLAYVFSF